MLRPLDRLIRRALRNRIPMLASDAHVRFQPPDAALRADVLALNALTLDVYLIELRENRKLRSNERIRTSNGNGQILLEPAPARMECHYLVSAWSPVQVTALEPTLDEHALLYDAAAALEFIGQLNPSRIYLPADPELALWPAEFRDLDLPTDVLLPESFGKHSDFWTTMGNDARWKPVLQLTVTIPITYEPDIAGFMVTTRITDYHVTGVAETSEVWIEIGGSVLDTLHPLPDGTPAPVTGAWVQLQNMAGTPLHLVTTDDDGHFLFERLHADQYQIRAGFAGLGERIRVVTVPSESGEYDVALP
ncbi:MAG TPA: Pvc16 family protein [Gemmatimonadaceae bacterium]|jgi:hypothetical protein|nr:Pvc16 family protein [Gemmatimonadaceae bacterium]